MATAVACAAHAKEAATQAFGQPQAALMAPALLSLAVAEMEEMEHVARTRQTVVQAERE